MNEIKVITYAESREAFFIKKLKQAERALDNQVKYGTDPDTCAEDGEIVSFYRDALTALREKTDRDAGCDFCMIDGQKMKHLILAETCGGDANFCPRCGRKLTTD